MIRILSILLAVTSLAWCENSLTGQERKEGFELLFDGKSINRWHSVRRTPNEGAWRVRNGILTHDKGESWLATNDPYADFVIRLDYRTGPGTDSGVLLRSGPTGDPATSGMELQILSDAGKPATTQSTGALWDVVPPTISANKPDGEWNQLEISLIKRQLIAFLNSQKILDVNLDDPKYPDLAKRLPYGHIGLQAHASGSPVEFRNIRIKILKIGTLFIPEK